MTEKFGSNEISIEWSSLIKVTFLGQTSGLKLAHREKLDGLPIVEGNLKETITS